MKEELETFKVQVISEVSLILKEISVLKEAITTHSNIDVLSGKAQTEEFYQEQLCFMNEESRSKDNLIISLLHQLSKQTEYITSLNNRFSNNAVDHLITIMTTLIVKITFTLTKTTTTTTIIIIVIIIIIIIIINDSYNIATTMMHLVVILIIAIHLITAQIFLIMIPIISTVTIIVTRIRITMIRNRILLLQINIRQMLIVELNVKLRSLKIILIRIMIVIIIIIITVVIIIIIIIDLTMKITQDTSITQEIKCSYLGIILSKMQMATS